MGGVFDMIGVVIMHPQFSVNLLGVRPALIMDFDFIMHLMISVLHKVQGKEKESQTGKGESGFIHAMVNAATLKTFAGVPCTPLSNSNLRLRMFGYVRSPTNEHSCPPTS